MAANLWEHHNARQGAHARGAQQTNKNKGEDRLRVAGKRRMASAVHLLLIHVHAEGEQNGEVQATGVLV